MYLHLKGTSSECQGLRVDGGGSIFKGRVNSIASMSNLLRAGGQAAFGLSALSLICLRRVPGPNNRKSRCLQRMSQTATALSLHQVSASSFVPYLCKLSHHPPSYGPWIKSQLSSQLHTPGSAPWTIAPGPVHFNHPSSTSSSLPLSFAQFTNTSYLQRTRISPNTYQ